MTYYNKHVFICINQRHNGKKCCNDADAQKICEYIKHKIKAMGLNGPGEIRVSSAGCLGRCAEGPILVVYPEAVWYTYQDTTDVDEIIETHLIRGEIVKRLEI